DLDWITLKAIAHEKSQRYGSAADLAEDIARFLADEPVTAHAPTAGYLLRKLVRRHRGRVIAGALVALSLVLGIVGTSVGLVRARAEAERANREAAAARRAQLSSDQLATYLEDLFGEADTSLENPAELTARQILERGVAGLESRLHDQPGKRAVLLHKLGEIYTRWDDFTTAEGLLTESLALLEAQRPGALADRLDVLETLADLRYEEGRYAEALELAERALGLSSDDSLATARLLIRAALAQQMSNRLDAAEGRLAESLELLDRLPADTPGRLDVLGRTYLGLGSVAQNRKNRPDLERGLDYTRQALAALEAAHGEESRQLVPALNNLAYLLVDTNRLGEAEATLRRSLELEERLLGESLSVARSQYLLGRVLNKQGKYSQAEQAFRRCVEIRRKLSPEPHPLHANALALLAYAIYVQRDGRTSEVETLFEEAEAVMRGREIAYPVFSAVMGLRARVDSGEGRPAAAEAHLRRSVAWLESLEDPPLRHISTVTMRLAETLLAQGRVEDAREACRESLRTAEQGAVANYVDRRKQELEALGCL
ncbi:MAG: tetratricopeptide repeat protein, partial [Acidobacteriota bacterium]